MWKVQVFLCIATMMYGNTVLEAYSYSFLSPMNTCTRRPPLQQRYGSTSLNMKINRGNGGSKESKGSTIQEIHNLRKRYAGKPGSKNFLDPNKVFMGNIPFHATEDEVKEFFIQQLGHVHNIDSFKIIRDWKTGQSKGYGFIQFTEPIYATAAMEMIKNKMFMGRIINLRQGMKKDDEETIRKRQMYVTVRSRGKYQLDEEGSIIETALNQVDDDDDDGMDTPAFTGDTDIHKLKMNPIHEDDSRRIHVDEDIHEELEEQEEDEVYQVNDFDNVDDSILFHVDNNSNMDENSNWSMEVSVTPNEENDESEDDYDGDFEEIYGSSKWEDLPSNGLETTTTTTMNRQQRREAAKRRLKRKIPHKGFG